MPGGAIYTAQVSLLQGKIAVPYSGNMSLLLATGSNVTVPVQGTYTGTTYAPAVRTPPQPWKPLCCSSLHNSLSRVDPVCIGLESRLCLLA